MDDEDDNVQVNHGEKLTELFTQYSRITLEHLQAAFEEDFVALAGCLDDLFFIINPALFHDEFIEKGSDINEGYALRKWKDMLWQTVQIAYLMGMRRYQKMEKEHGSSDD